MNLTFWAHGSSHANHAMLKKARLSLISIAFLTGITCFQYPPAQAASGCKLSDLSIKAKIPFGYTRVPTECPMVAYQRNLSRNLVRGFYFVETPAPYSFSDKQTPTDFVNGQISITISTFFTHGILAREIHETADYPPSFIEQGGACGGIVAPIELQEGSEWRRGIICVAKLPPKGYEEWSTLIQAFFFDRHLTRPSYKPGDDFEQAARKLFRSIRLRELN